MKQIDTEAIRFHIRGILEALGDDPDREGLKETPDRVARMYEEVFEGMKYSNDEIAAMFDKTFAEDVDDEGTSRYGDMVVVKDIDIFSYCEHHIALMYDMKVSVAYIPKGKVIGLSKIARIADMAAKRLQLQERLGNDIAVTGTHRFRHSRYNMQSNRFRRCCCIHRGLSQLYDSKRNKKDQHKNIYTDIKREVF